MPSFFTRELETVATYWQIYRTDGVALGFTSHDRSLSFDGLTHHGAPGMVPSAIRLTDSLTPDSAEVEGALSHDLITGSDLIAGAYDHARILIGAVNWETLETCQVYSGRIGQIDFDGLHFSAEIQSSKHELEVDLVPRTSPSCRADFCDMACGLNAEKFTQFAMTDAIDTATNRVLVIGVDLSLFSQGTLRFCDGPQVGTIFGIIDSSSSGFLLDRALAAESPQRLPVKLRQGCDRTFLTCRTRFSNATNFRGEPFLPGNDLLARYPKPQ